MREPQFTENTAGFARPSEEKEKIFLPLLLFVITFFTTMFTGLEWMGYNPSKMELTGIVYGLPYSLSILFFLTCHEFGHYFAARYHGVRCTFPYYIPMTSFFGALLNFGTMGAVIKMKSAIPSKKALFDIGAAGPIAGFFACLLLLIYGFTHLPGVDYLLRIHPDYYSPEYGKNGLQLEFGSSLLYVFLQKVFTSPGEYVPPMSEMYHYPYLCAGWFGLFVTTLNMIPIGQLDGGHIVYAMFGEKTHNRVGSIALIALFVSGVVGVLKAFVFSWLPGGWIGWFVWALVIFFILKTQHPPVYDSEPLDPVRKTIGYASLSVLVLCFVPVPFNIAF